MENFEKPDFDYKEEVSKCKTLDDVMGKIEKWTSPRQNWGLTLVQLTI
ncbi:hypothetical protein G4W71_04910 [Clostridium botulinum]|nr:hypothetical protein [Clostridium botulinum]MBE1303380.1 hypothetical protein [Clostridium botulinum]